MKSSVANAWSKWRDLIGVIFDKKVPTIMKVLIYQTVVRLTLLYGCETWTMSVKDEKRMTATEMVRWAMRVSLLEHRRNKEILAELIAMVMRSLERFRAVEKKR